MSAVETEQRGLGRWLLACAGRYALTFVAGWSIFAVVSDVRAMVIGAMPVALVLLGAPSLAVLLPVAWFRRSRFFRWAAVPLLLLPLLMWWGSGDVQVIAVLAVIQTAFGAWLMPRA